MQEKIYLVGGAVRDQLLHLPVLERDWVVVGATADEMRSAGFRQADLEFPVFIHPGTHEEYALARRETKTGPGYRGFAVDAAPDVSLEEDLARRDLTINALAQDTDGQLIDPFGGLEDLRQGLLRHITPAFAEDPVRLLRIARFAARFGAFGFRVAHPTHRLMKQMVAGGAVAELQPQRIWQEMSKAMGYAQPWRFFEVLQACGALHALLPGLAEGTFSGHAAESSGAASGALKAAAALSEDPEVRLAAALMGIPEDVDELRLRLGLSRKVIDLVSTGRSLWPRVRQLDGLSAAERESVLRDMGAWRQGERFDQLMLVFSAQPDAPHGLARLSLSREAGRAVDTAALQAQGLQGAALGQALTAARIAAIKAVSD
jgi:tRNA nucleotidyltransferase (CCA-adding enzyme)